MQTAQMGTIGYPPKVETGKGNPEAQKYGRMWEYEEYRKIAPGEILAQTFLRTARPKPGSTCIDFGCGTGRGALMLALLGQMKVTMVDFVRNCLDPEVRQACETQGDALKFLKHDIEQPLPPNVAAEYGYCTDVLEHIPDSRLTFVLENILKAAQHVFFSISMDEDKCGELIGEVLHVSKHDYHWWCWQFAKHNCVIHWSSKTETNCYFYVSAWKTGKEISKTGVINIEEEEIKQHVEFNVAQGWEQVRPYPVHDVEVMILGGGPSLNKFEDEIKQKRAEGVKLITLNGAYHWAIAHGLTPSAQVIVDGRQFNERFTRPVVPDCRYLIASQCHPDVFEGLPKDRTYIWHATGKLIEDILNKQYDTGWYSIPGGSSVLLRAIPLFRMLGFRRFHLYGCDSCLTGDEHHAYEQKENDSGQVVATTVNGRMFQCYPWMVAQASDFMEMIRMMGDEIELAVYGDGLLAHIINQGIESLDLKE